jgi:Gas vesicle protein
VVNEVFSGPSPPAVAQGSASARYGGRQVTLIDLLDRLLAGGVVIEGHITLSVADIDLVELDLGIILAATDKVMRR